MKNLQTLFVYSKNYQVEPSFLKAIELCPIKYLTLYHTTQAQRTNTSDMKVPHPCLTPITKLVTLEILCLFNIQFVNDAFLVSLASHCVKLQKLNISC